MPIRIDQKLCSGCSACTRVCPYDAIDVIDRRAFLNESCVHCGACVESCKFKAILYANEAAPQADLASYRGVMVFIETFSRHPAKVSLELLGCGRTLANSKSVPLSAVWIGNDISAQASSIGAFGADLIYLVEDPELSKYRVVPYCRVVSSIIRQVKPEIVLFGASILGRDLAPRVANRLKTGLTADCTELSIDPSTGALLQTRPAFGGNVMATIVCPNHRPQMATVRPGVMKPLPYDSSRRGEIVPVSVGLKKSDLKVLIREVIKETHRKIDLSEAEIIVAGGRGVGGKSQFGVIFELADSLNGEVGASRAAVEAGWVGNEHQVGQTGKAVRPKLYIACGISGAIQHLAGISGADFIVAINLDSQAPIFKMADVSIVGDLHRVLPLLIAEVQKFRKESEKPC